MSDHCLKCNAEIIRGKTIAIINGKKAYPEFDLDGTTSHVCKPKDQGKKFPPRKPQESFELHNYIRDEKGQVIYEYVISRSGNVGEFDAVKTLSELKMALWKLAAAEQGNPQQKKVEA